MAKTRTNALLEGFTGSIGELVAKRSRSGRLYLSRKPSYPGGRQFTAAQLAHQARFKAAAAYARQAARTEPAYAALAKKTGQPAYNVALSDYLHPPTIAAVERMGDTLRIHATDEVAVVRVTVTALGADGRVLAEGAATPAEIDGWWRFDLAAGAARARVTALDRPGNEAVKEVEFTAGLDS